MEIRFEPATKDHILVFAAWKYEPPYELYSIDMEADDAVTYFLRSDVGCHVPLNGDRVIGFATFGSDAQVPGGDYTASAVDIGLGIEPSMTGQRNGKHYVAAVVAFARETFGTGTLRVSIAETNERALRVWSGHGFRRVTRAVITRLESPNVKPSNWKQCSDVQVTLPMWLIVPVPDMYVIQSDSMLHLPSKNGSSSTRSIAYA